MSVIKEKNFAILKSWKLVTRLTRKGSDLRVHAKGSLPIQAANRDILRALAETLTVRCRSCGSRSHFTPDWH